MTAILISVLTTNNKISQPVNLPNSFKTRISLYEVLA